MTEERSPVMDGDDNDDHDTDSVGYAVSFQNNTLAPNYKPRYAHEETLEESAPSSSSSWTWSACRAIAWVCAASCRACGRVIASIARGDGRRRRRGRWWIALTIVVLVGVVGNALLASDLGALGGGGGGVLGVRDDASLARADSYGYFFDVPSRRWREIRTRVREARSRARDPTDWGPEFECPTTTTTVGGRTLCAPANAARRGGNDADGCLVYASRADVDAFAFETELRRALGKDADACEIHVFSPNPLSRGKTAPPPGVVFHAWGFRGAENNGEDGDDWRTIPVTAVELGHAGRTIDLFILDCEGCEYRVLEDTLLAGTDVRQASVQLHGARDRPEDARTLFDAMRERGYVLYDRRPDKADDTVEDYGWIRLAPSFFQ